MLLYSNSDVADVSRLPTRKNNRITDRMHDDLPPTRLEACEQQPTLILRPPAPYCLLRGSKVNSGAQSKENRPFSGGRPKVRFSTRRGIYQSPWK
jgi:hypothetical protein